MSSRGVNAWLGLIQCEVTDHSKGSLRYPLIEDILALSGQGSQAVPVTCLRKHALSLVTRLSLFISSCAGGCVVPHSCSEVAPLHVVPESKTKVTQKNNQLPRQHTVVGHKATFRDRDKRQVSISAGFISLNLPAFSCSSFSCDGMQEVITEMLMTKQLSPFLISCLISAGSLSRHSGNRPQNKLWEAGEHGDKDPVDRR